jgi:F0F1-type ATP synthase beta subunit
MSSGKVVQVIGAVIDVEFPRDSVPQVYTTPLRSVTKGLPSRCSSSLVMVLFARLRWGRPRALVEVWR